MAVHLVRSIFGADMHHYEHRIRGVRIVVITQDPLDGAGSGGGLGGGGDGGGLGGGGDGGGLGGGDGDAPSVPERPTILFVPGGAFIADFEAVDLFFLYKWVREAQATLVYVTYVHLPYLTISTNRSPRPSLTFHCPLVYRYEFAPQAPYPTGMMQVAAVYRALRDGSHDAALGFRATPLVVAGLSAGGNLAVSAILSILHPALLTRSPHGGGTAGAADTSAAAANGRPLLNAMGSSYARSCYNPRLAAPATAVAITRDWPLPPPQWPSPATGRSRHRSGPTSRLAASATADHVLAPALLQRLLPSVGPAVDAAAHSGHAGRPPPHLPRTQPQPLPKPLARRIRFRHPPTAGVSSPRISTDRPIEDFTHFHCPLSPRSRYSLRVPRRTTAAPSRPSSVIPCSPLRSPRTRPSAACRRRTYRWVASIHSSTTRSTSTRASVGLGSPASYASTARCRTPSSHSPCGMIYPKSSRRWQRRCSGSRMRCGTTQATPASTSPRGTTGRYDVWTGRLRFEDRTPTRKAPAGASTSTHNRVR